MTELYSIIAYMLLIVFATVILTVSLFRILGWIVRLTYRFFDCIGMNHE